ncbi:uncharacterized protein F4807DRAFT_418427 [Annulohypoxylon truncatum]|uniref:uncharacterized protein n=1 Tax=Annulohypoxylon truncatum TaxID=327061 RepID=UPI0020082A53|nr:uncharacterized protein F4807DRAFT_418427 [Annulohypoxylon truncatum]KAI1211606.1 hypothetical protein F4807DRAFT_418427 [Annulohypoxylon truncatum]
MSTPPSTDLEAVLKTFPHCGLNCFLEAVVSQSNCTISDPACACASQPLQKAAAECIAQSCTLPDALKTQNLTNSLCGISSYHDRTYLEVIYTFVALASVFVALRFLARLAKRNPLWWDDYFTLLSLLVAIGFTSVCGAYDRLGVGLDIWAVPQQNLQSILILLYTALLCYSVSRFFVRVSLILFLLRIFRVSGARQLIILTLILNAAVTTAWMFCIIFQCTPVAYFWKGWDGLHDGSCIDQWAMFLAGGIVATALDVFLILLPARWIFQLQFSLAKKMTTIAMFSLGLIVIVTSVLRIVALHKFIFSNNRTRDLTTLVIWGGMELYVAIICACLPSLRPLVQMTVTRFQSWATRGSQNSVSSSSGNQKYWIRSSSKKGLPDNSIQQAKAGVVVGRPPNIWLTTTIQQQHQARPASESELNLTKMMTNDIELYDRQKGNSRGDAWA